MIFAGALDETLTFYQVTETQSDSGYKTKTETLRFSCNAEKVKNKGDLIVSANELFHSLDLTFRLRYRSQIQQTDIVKYQGEKYQIMNIDNYGRTEMVIRISKIDE